MRVVLAPIFALALMGATDVDDADRSLQDRSGAELQAVQDAEQQPETGEPREWDQEAIDRAITSGLGELAGRLTLGENECRDRIMQAREASGQPPLLDREPASPDEAYAIYAVDRQQDGCSVMVMMGSRGDIRPLPGPMEGPMLIIPADAER